MRQKNREELVSNQIRFVLRKLMTNANIKDSKLSQILNIPSATLYKILNDEYISPRIETLRPIARYFNITIDQLIGDSPLENKKERDALVNEPKEFREWRPDLFKNCIDEVTKALNQKKQVVSFEQALQVSKEIYLYFLIKNEKKVDKDFVQWAIEHTL